jgi:TPP-dependent pyruvate/acetoin dehydrogenase alpha subunit
MTPKTKEQGAPPPAAQNGFSLISNGKLLQLYSTMLKCRMLHEHASILIKQNKLNQNACAHARLGNLGWEAAAVGVTIDLLPQDTVASLPGDAVLLFMRDLPIETTLIHPIGPSSQSAAQLKIATDAAMANKLKSNSKIAVAFSTGNSASRSAWDKALSLASLKDLPMIFVSRDSHSANSHSAQFSISGRGQKARIAPLKIKAYTFPVIPVDGNDVVAVYRVASEAIAHARKGNGPTLIECQSPSARDPILNMEKYLAGKGLFSEAFKTRQIAGFRNELTSALEAAGNRSE